MANLVGELIENFTGGGQQQQFHAPTHPQYQGPPQAPRPWRAEWDGQDQRWFYVNEETGERTFNFPGGAPPQQQQQQHKSHEGLYAVGGLLAGAAAMYEGEKIHRDWDEDKARMEGDVRRDEQRFDNDVDQVGDAVADAPEDAARWAGRKVQDVEDIPQDVDNDVNRFDNRVEQGFDNAVDNAAGAIGDAVGGVERFDNNVDNSFDQGEAQGRNDGW